ncbi:MAG: hypothetical protein US98_C0005G0009 [Parcubacteria group bacterium GW2011_GWC1_38_6]|nr:MAG: hypothetical protein US98_C0005G0009 [Parcubacteria group bacterium GW2011_GWC1_38_6]
MIVGEIVLFLLVVLALISLIQPITRLLFGRPSRPANKEDLELQEILRDLSEKRRVLQSRKEISVKRSEINDIEAQLARISLEEELARVQSDLKARREQRDQMKLIRRSRADLAKTEAAITVLEQDEERLKIAIDSNPD